MDSEKVKWLKKRYCPTPTDGDVTSIKRVKFDDIKQDMIAQFPTKRLSVYQVSKAITAAFTNTYSRASSHNRTKHIFGLEKRPTTEHAQTCATPSTSREACSRFSNSSNKFSISSLGSLSWKNKFKRPRLFCLCSWNLKLKTSSLLAFWLITVPIQYPIFTSFQLIAWSLNIKSVLQMCGS